MELIQHIFEHEHSWLWGSLFIFCARIVDVSLDTVRILLVARGKRLLAPLTGFVQVLVWVLVIGSVIQNLNNLIYCVAYAGGFAVGNYVGILLEDRIAIGFVIIRVITRRSADELIQFLREQHYAVTAIPASGPDGPVNIIFMVVKRKQIQNVIHLVQEYNPRAFYSIEDVRSVSELPTGATHRISRRRN